MADYFGKLRAEKIFAKMETVAELREHSIVGSDEAHFCNELLRVYLEKLKDIFIFSNLTDSEIKLGCEVSKLEAVKAFKNRTGASLLHAKQNVERFFEAHGYNFRPLA